MLLLQNAMLPRPLMRPLTAALTSRLRSRRVVIVSSLVALSGLTAVLVNVFVVSSAPPASDNRRPAANAKPNPDATEPVPVFHVPAPVVRVVLPNTGAIPLPSGAKPAAAAWISGRGGALLTAVTSQAGDVAQASGLKQYVQMKQACVTLAASVSSAQSGPPIPVADMESQYQKALSELAKAAAACQAAISEEPDGDEYVSTTENSADLSASALALAAGSRDLYQATGQISNLAQAP